MVENADEEHSMPKTIQEESRPAGRQGSGRSALTLLLKTLMGKLARALWRVFVFGRTLDRRIE